eukprot:s1218_g5.t1
MLSPYRVLGIQPGCNEEELRAAYKKRALETHPDKGGNVEEFRSVKTAYEALLKTVPTQLARKASNGSTSPSSEFSDASVFTPFSTPFPDAFRAAAAAAAAFKAPTKSQRSEPRKRRRTLEETIELAFAGIPSMPSMHRINRAPKAAPTPKAKPVPSPKTNSGPKLVRTPERPPERAERPMESARNDGTTGTTEASVKVEDAFAAKLWARLLQLTMEKRSEAISSLPSKTKERLEAFLRAKKRERSTQGDTAGDSESESSSESSSSSTEASSDAEPSKASTNDAWTLNRYRL